MKGSYGLQSEEIDFAGDVRLDARVLQTMTGVKRVLMVPIDPLFKKNGAGTYLPVNISGRAPSRRSNWIGEKFSRSGRILRPTFPFPSPPGPVLERRMQRCSHVERRAEGQG